MRRGLILSIVTFCASACQIADAPCLPTDALCQPWGPILFSRKNKNGPAGFSRLYFLTGTGTVQRMSVDGSGRETVRSGLNTPASMAFGSDSVFWTDNSTEVHRLDAAGVQTQIVSAYYGGMYFNSSDGYLYGMEVGSLELRRFRPDGSGEIGVNFSGATQEDSRLVVDPAGQIAYVSSGTAGSDTIRRLTLDGGSTAITLVSGNNDPSGFCVDLTGDTMCWVERAGQRLQCSRLEGGGITQILSGLNDPRSLVCDFARGYFYIGEGTGNRILRVDRAGQGQVVLFSGFDFVDMVGVR